MNVGDLAENAERALWALEDALDDLASHHRSPTSEYDLSRLRRLRSRWERDTERKLNTAGILRRPTEGI